MFSKSFFKFSKIVVIHKILNLINNELKFDILTVKLNIKKHEIIKIEKITKL